MPPTTMPRPNRDATPLPPPSPAARSVHALALAALLLAALGGCRPKEVAAEGRAPAPPAATEVFALQEERMATTLRVPGELASFERVDLYAKVSSFVRRVHVDVGSEVKTGQLLATLEAPELGSQLAEADSTLQSQEALYAAAKANYDRLVRASKTPGTISPNDLEQGEARVASEEAKLRAARASKQALASIRDYLEMKAPFPGVITARNVSPGAYVGPSGRGSDQPLFVLQQQDRLRLVVSVPEAYVGYLSPDSEVSFTVRARPGERFTAKVARVAGALDARLRSERTEMNVTNEAKRLLPGMVADVTLPMENREARHVIPRSALVSSTTGSFVVRAEERKARWVPVQTGREEGDRVEIFGDLRVGDVLVASAGEELRDGSPLENTTQKPAPPRAP